MRVREAAAQVGDFAERPAAEEGSRKGTAICRESGDNFGDMTTPLGNQLEPKVCQDRESFEHWEEAIARLRTKKSSVDKFWVVRLAWQAKRLQGIGKAGSLQLEAGASDSGQVSPQASF
jgi:hypothetical protein